MAVSREILTLMEAALTLIREELDIAMWNIHQKEYESPFNNTGNTFSCDEFMVMAYDWSNEERPCGFRWKEIYVSWYKSMGRSTFIHGEVTADRIAEMLVACLDAIDAYEVENNADRRYYEVGTRATNMHLSHDINPDYSNDPEWY